MTIYDNATEEDDRNVCNTYVCYKPDALWPYWRSIGMFAIHVAIAKKNKLCQNTWERCEQNVYKY